jgi:Fe-S-cluster containining protein
MNDQELSKLKEKASNEEAANKAFLKKLKRLKNKRKLDDLIHQLHDEAFEEIDCLECANCCKSISPIIYEKDIHRISKYLKIKPSEFTEQYLTVDEDGDYIFKQTPCPFLLPDNYCSIYSLRPRSCREYPHTDRKNMQQILDLTLKNTFICPAVYRIVLELRKHF